MISVVIPCYNQAHFLAEAVESVLAQTWPDREVVVVDDGSQDDPAGVVARYPGVRLVRQPNQGVSAARNRGLSESRGEYLVFLDADDRLLPEALETGLRHLSARPECVMAAGHYRNISSDGRPLPTPAQPVVERDHYATLLRGGDCVWLPAAVLYRRAVFDAVEGFDPERQGCADFDLYLRIARSHPVCCHGEVVVEYRQHPPSMSRNSAHMLRDAMAAFRAQQRYVSEHPEYAAAFREGRRVFRHYYGDKLVHDIRVNLRERRWRQVTAGALALARLYPQTIPRHLASKLYCLARGIPREQL